MIFARFSRDPSHLLLLSGWSRTRAGRAGSRGNFGGCISLSLYTLAAVFPLPLRISSQSP